MLKVPANRHASEVGIHQYRAIAVVPSQAQQTSLSRAILVQSLAKFFNRGVRAPGNGAENVARRRESGFDSRESRMHTARNNPTNAWDQLSFRRRSEERRVGKEWRCGMGADHKKKKNE